MAADRRSDPRWQEARALWVADAASGTLWEPTAAIIWANAFMAPQDDTADPPGRPSGSWSWRWPRCPPWSRWSTRSPRPSPATAEERSPSCMPRRRGIAAVRAGRAPWAADDARRPLGPAARLVPGQLADRATRDGRVRAAADLAASCCLSVTAPASALADLASRGLLARDGGALVLTLPAGR
jgi:hypothetical protein